MKPPVIRVPEMSGEWALHRSRTSTIDFLNGLNATQYFAHAIRGDGVRDAVSSERTPAVSLAASLGKHSLAEAVLNPVDVLKRPSDKPPGEARVTDPLLEPLATPMPIERGAGGADGSLDELGLAREGLLRSKLGGMWPIGTHNTIQPFNVWLRMPIHLCGPRDNPQQDAPPTGWLPALEHCAGHLRGSLPPTAQVSWLLIVCGVAQGVLARDIPWRQGALVAWEGTGS